MKSQAEGDGTAGYPLNATDATDATDAAIAANVVAARYRRVPQSFPVIGAPYMITNVNSGKAVQPDSCATANGTLVRQWAQLDNTCQEWDLTS
ncbi:MAG TPA: RICIN domain-containing protein [Trebonia sp.]|nr:RICIN domain-containing protein [Trebonia sp.]